MTFTQKLLSVEFNLASGNFSGGGNAATLSGLRMSATIDVSGGVSSGTMELAIYGLPLSLMNQLSTVGKNMWQLDKNSVALYAGEAGGQMSLAFSGLIHNAFVDAKSMPQVCFRISAVPGGAYFAVTPAAPISKPGSQDVAAMMGQLASQMGLTLENNGVNVKLMNPYYGGSAWRQAINVAKHANIDMVVEKGVLAITPAGQPRNGSASLVSPQTGMVGYPAFRQASIIVTSIYNPSIKVNANIQVQSDITPACGTWTVFHMVHELECMMPHGKWFSLIEANPAGQEPS